MARVEVPVQTPLRFHSYAPGFAPPLAELGKPETVTIEYEGRELVWHESGLSDGVLEPAYDYAPTVTVVVADGDDDSALYGLILRFLSGIAFHYQVGTSTSNPGGSGETDPLHPALSRQRYALFIGKQLASAPVRIDVIEDERLRLALAVYREGASTASPYLAFVAFWNAIEAAHDGKREAVNSFLNTETAKVADVTGYVQSVLKLPRGQQPPGDLATYFRDHGRDAIAHVSRDRPPWTEINPDNPDDRFRLDADTWFLRALARRALEARWPTPVIVTPRT